MVSITASSSCPSTCAPIHDLGQSPTYSSTPIKIDAIAPVLKELLLADKDTTKDTTVVLDIDGTVIESYNPPYILYTLEQVPKEHIEFMKYVKDLLAAYAIEVGPNTKRDIINSFLMMETKKERVEDEVPEFIRQLQIRGIRVIGLTGCPAGSFGSVACGRTLRDNNLRNLGFDFSSASPQKEIVFTNLKAYNGTHPMFYNGIGYTNWNNAKGPVLSSIFDSIGWPKKVIMFEDLKEPLESCSIEMEQHNVPFQGYLRQGAKKHPPPEFDRQAAELQLQNLILNDRITTTNPAKKSL